MINKEFTDAIKEAMDKPLKIELRSATDQLIGTRTRLHASTEAEILANDALKTKKAALLAAEEIKGKNADERDAKLKVATETESNALREAEKAVHLARLDFENASDRLLLLRDLLRCEELTLKA